MEQYRKMREEEIQSWEEYADNIELVMTDMLAMVQANAVEIGTVITETAYAHGIQISEALTQPWFTAEQTIAQYGEVLSAATSSFIASLEGVEQETWNLQAQADATSVQLSAMFGNRADNLVSELQRSWDSEENLRNVTNALNEAFVEAIDTGGRINEIVAPMEEAKAATDAVASAADGAASSFDNMASSARSAGRAAQEAIKEYHSLREQINATSYADAAKGAIFIKGLKGGISAGAGGFAKGLSKAQQDELAWTQELGDEVIVSPTRSSILTPIKKGDAVLTADMTKNLWELAKINPKDLMKNQSIGNLPTVQQNKNVSLNFGAAVQVSGNVNDSMAMIKIASQEAQSKIAKTLKDLNDEIKY